MDTVLDNKTLSGILLLNDEDTVAALEMAKNFNEALGPEGVQIAEYTADDGLTLVFAEPFGYDKITGIRFHTTDPEVVCEILEMFQFGHFEKTFGQLAGDEYFFHEKKTAPANK